MQFNDTIFLIEKHIVWNAQMNWLFDIVYSRLTHLQIVRAQLWYAVFNKTVSKNAQKYKTQLANQKCSVAFFSKLLLIVAEFKV